MRANRKIAHGGFTLLELLIALALGVIIIGAIFMQIMTANQRSANEQKQLDLFQEAREYVDQISRDMRQIGYPNPRNIDTDNLTASDMALGLLKVDDRDISFEGGVDNLGKVLSTQYTYDSSTTNNCPCLQRSQELKSATSSGQMEVQNVQNYVNGNNIAIFQYYTQGGTVQVTYPATSPLAYDSLNGTNAVLLAAIDTIKVQLVVQSPYADLKTGAKPIVTLVSTVKVNNCIQSSTGTLSCQY
jgi:prepilin-type N-terminal cleavage/methylation domain-containing protein